MTALMQEVRSGQRRFDQIPNLLYKTSSGDVESTGFSHKPMARYNDATVDWSYYQGVKSELLASRLIMTLPNTGCAHDCPWCGGSRFAYRNMMGVERTLIQKDHGRIADELRTMGDAAKTTSIYALQCYSETKRRLHEYLDVIEEMGYSSVFFEQFHLPPADTMAKMARATQSYIMLSPESHDQVISKLAGRGNYSMAEMERWIPRALDAGIRGVMVWFFIGMPRQDRQSVLDTVAYAESLLKKFPGGKVLPLICPMVPFLDPGSRFFEEPERHGYTIFHRTLEEHRQAMVAPVWHQRLNYETRWLSRRGLQDVTYEVVKRLVEIKGELGILRPAWSTRILETIDETQGLLAEIEEAHRLDGRLPDDLANRVREYNGRILAYSSDQIIPLPRPFGGRWFDDFTVPEELIRDVCEASAASRVTVPAD